MYSKSRCLSKLPEAFKLAVTSFQSWHFSTVLNIPFSGLGTSLWVALRTFALFSFLLEIERCVPVAKLCSPACQAPPMLFLDIQGESIFFASLISSSQLTLVLTENIKKQHIISAMKEQPGFGQWMGTDKALPLEGWLPLSAQPVRQTADGSL